MAAPLIGITTHPASAPDWAELGELRALIVQAVERAGGLPVIVPLGVGPETLRGLYRRLDGLLLAGGGDVDPARYGAGPHPALAGVDAGRDETELALARWAAAEFKPMFGICRGAQVLNVALGGTLYRDISEHPGAGRHSFWPNLPRDLRPHAVRIEEDSTLARLVGEPTLTVNSLHHQACRDLGEGLWAVAIAPDGLIEAIEVAGHPFALAVQWHPECLPDAPEMQRLFAGFVEAAGSGSQQNAKQD